MGSSDGEEKVIATAQHIVNTLGSTETLTDDMMLHIFSEFDGRLSSMSRKLPRKYKEAYSAENLEEALDYVEERIMRWEVGRGCMIWCGGAEEASLYLEAVDDVQNMVEALSQAPDDGKEFGSLDRAKRILEQGMARLEEEFRMLLDLENRGDAGYPEWGWGIDASSQPALGGDDKASHTSAAEDEGEEDVPVAQPVTDLNFTIDMVPSEIVVDLNEIAKRMVGAGYVAECCQVYSSIRRTFLEESIARLGFEKLSMEEVHEMEWEALEVEISKWIQALKVSIMVFFPSERKLCERIFVDIPSFSDTCFADLARGAVTQLLNFAESVAISRRSPERLFKILDMYEILRDLLPEINVVFAGEASSELRLEASTIWMQLGEAARGTFVEFENAIQRDTAKNPVLGGAVHPLTRYVMNYMRFACDYKETLEQILREDMAEDPRAPGNALNCSGDFLSENGKNSVDELSLWSIQTHWIMELLERSLDAKSMSYKDPALSCLFLMNNSRYIVQKVKDSEIGNMLGDDWVQKHSAKVRQYRKNYQRTAWGKVLSCLKDDGLWAGGNFSGGVSSAVLKDRLKSFNTLFEEIHKTQSAWIVADDQLRTELRISIAEMVIPAYRTFVGQVEHFLVNGKHPEKHIKYLPEDLETSISELFEGTSGSGSSSMNRRKSLPNS